MVQFAFDYILISVKRYLKGSVLKQSPYE
jgi:hypothetical protein